MNGSGGAMMFRQEGSRPREQGSEENEIDRTDSENLMPAGDHQGFDRSVIREGYILSVCQSNTLWLQALVT